MAARTDIFDLGQLQLSPGSARRVDLGVQLDAFEFGGQTYAAQAALTPVVLDVSRTLAGYFMRLRFESTLDGPCVRCLEAADVTVDVDDRQVDQPGDDDEDLTSEYLEGDELDVHSWARDALALALPVQIVCRDDCRGLCPVCGENLNEAGPEHFHESEPDARWSKLSELRFE
ncbi:MAG: hypothetical protein QOE06_3092 [Thermoleophilaceae bacterium]|nr:hypothetical protein [Thermoleophilaceae bacterium]